MIARAKKNKLSQPILLTIVFIPLSLVFAQPTRAQAIYTAIYSYYSPERSDNFATTDPRWAGSLGDEKSPDYRLFRIEGWMFNPNQPQPSGTVPVYSWYSPERGDNFLTSDPRWRGAPGETRSPDYRFVRLAGYAFDPSAPPPQGTIPLCSWYDPSRGDNFATTNRLYAGVRGVSEREPQYRYVRREGYVVPHHPTPDLASMIVPVYFQFQESHIDATTGLPAFGSGDARQTMLVVDEALVKLNEALKVARGFDSRSITFARAGVKYVPTPTEDSEQTTPLYHWWSVKREDNFATTAPGWRILGVEDEERLPNYRPVGKLAVLFRPDRPQPVGTIPVHSWFNPDRGRNPERGDNFMTSDPSWRGVPGDTKRGYRFVRLEGFLYDPARPQPADTVELHSWYSPSLGDNFVSSSHLWFGAPGETRPPDYRYVRKEGYARLPAGCNLLGGRVASDLLPGAINVLVTSDCGGVAISPNIIRADAESLAHELGHAMGQYHMFEGNSAPATVELLYRELDPTKPKSCYRLGDRVCDTPPDYGFADEDGIEHKVCDGGVPAPCEQSGPVCDPQEPMVDGVGLCTGVSDRGKRRYEAVALGLQLGTPNNIMAYHNQDEFSYEQFLRILDYGLWRAGKKDLVPDDQKFVFRDFSFAPSSFWASSPSGNLTLSYAKREDIPRMTPTRAGANWRSTVSSTVGTRLLNFRVEISGSGRATDEVSLVVGLPDGFRQIFERADLLVEDDLILFDEIYGRDISHLRGKVPGGAWSVELRAAGTFSPDNAHLSVLAE